ncbi:hypothetical protein DAEQUDRAFT_727753 [Daedalea quercina L-15889]|uniref:Uncharacterized protein n=1 Tax=Daedalea quercina L-15889 TaxID=1314783 RepID=A0A165PUC8_9APHY|nr:hypothetical protein DAEQUDRAFT_727753 [Daedalea quercina L-15889]
MKKFEEGVFSDLRNLKPGVDACLEEPKVNARPLLPGLFSAHCIARTCGGARLCRFREDVCARARTADGIARRPSPSASARAYAHVCVQMLSRACGVEIWEMHNNRVAGRRDASSDTLVSSAIITAGLPVLATLARPCAQCNERLV